MTDELVERLGLSLLPEYLKTKTAAAAMDLSGRVAVVTGGGGIGLGRAIVDRLAWQGAIVSILDRDLLGAESVSEAMRTKWRASINAIECDVTNSGSVQKALDRCGPVLTP